MIEKILDISIAELLKKQTASRHAKLEEKMNVKRMFDNSFTLEQYKQIVLVNYRAILTLEEAIHEALPLDLQNELSVASRKKSVAIQKDMDQLGMKDPEADQSHPQKNLSVAEALGAMYVLEGATLGGNVIAKQLRKSKILKDQSFFFYTVYGNTVREKWLKFLEVLNREVSLETSGYCIDKANETFDRYYDIAAKVIQQ